MAGPVAIDGAVREYEYRDAEYKYEGGSREAAIRLNLAYSTSAQRYSS